MYDRRVSSEVYHVLRPMPTVEFTLILDYQGHNTEGPLQGSWRRLWTQAVWKSFFPSRINILRTQSYISLARSLVNITTSWNRQLAYHLYLNFMSHQHYISFGKPHKSPSSTDKNGRDDLEIITDKEKLAAFVSGSASDNSALLLMSSGNWGGLNMKELAIDICG